MIEGTIQVYNARGVKANIPCTRHLVYQGGGLNPGLVVWPDGEMIMHCRGVANHASRVGNVVLRRSKDGGVTWSDPKVIIEKPDVDCRNQEMCIAPNGDLVCIYCDRERKQGETTKANPANKITVDWGVQEWRMYSTVSKDRGETWCTPVQMKDPKGWTLISPFAGGNIGVLRDGRMVAPAFVVKEGTTYINQPVEEWAAFLIESRDGLNWTCPNGVIPGWSDEVDVTELPEEIGGGLVALNRMGGVKFHAIFRQFSTDYGISWDKPEMVAFDGMHPATSLWIGDDYLMTVGSRRYPFGARGVVSRDFGVTFDWVHQIVFSDNCGIEQERRDNGYPTSVLLPDGLLYTVWYKSHSDHPYFPETGGVYTAEACKAKWSDIKEAIESPD
jgi:hypothetical protein